MATHRIKIDHVTGVATMIYADELRPLAEAIGDIKIARASHVEPTGDGRWAADLAPVGGPVLGPFDLKEDALREEVAWLNANLLSPPA